MKKLLILISLITLVSCNKNIDTTNNIEILIGSEIMNFDLKNDKEKIKKIILDNNELFIDFPKNSTNTQIESILNSINNNSTFLKISIYQNNFGKYIYNKIEKKNINNFIIEIRECKNKVIVDENFGNKLLNYKNNLEFSCTNTIENNGIIIESKEQKYEIEKNDKINIYNFN